MYNITFKRFVHFTLNKINNNNLPHAGFLTAVLQNHARKLGISVDSLSFEFAVRHSSWDTDDSLNDIQRKLDLHQLAFTVIAMCSHCLFLNENVLENICGNLFFDLICTLAILPKCTCYLTLFSLLNV